MPAKPNRSTIMAVGRNERALSRPSIPLAAHSTFKTAIGELGAISSAVSLSSR